MDVSPAFLVAAGALIIAIWSPFSVAQPAQFNYDPATHQNPPERRDSFIDFSLQRVNPSNKDYGECMSEGRPILLDETVRNAYFWSNIVALGMLACLFGVIVYQHRVQTKHDWTHAEMAAQLEQALARSRAHIGQVTERNRALAESLADLKHAARQSLPNPADPADRPPSRPTRSHSAVTPASVTSPPNPSGEKPRADRPSPAAETLRPSSQIALFKPEVELVTKVNALEQQLGRSQEMEKQLRRQLYEAGRKLQAEHERNRSLRVEQTL
jgi:hypothetical protein